MNRRNFLRSGSVASLTLPALVSAATPAAFPADNEAEVMGLKENDLVEVTIDELQQKMKNGQLSSKAITKWYLKRIDNVDKKGPSINSVIEVNPDAILIAETMDAERKAGRMRGPLHGIPVLIKDNIDTADKMMTTAGSLALVGNRASKDAFIVKKLRAAGAVILGKTNLSEFANFRSSRSTSAWSSRGGQTRCPYILNRNPSGSSAGSGAAAAASLCAVAIGTETNGSIVSPASINGLVGFKPTVGLWGRSGIIPISATQDTAGPMTRTVKDAAILLSALSEVDPDDAVTSESIGKAQRDYTSFLDADGLRGKRIGVDTSFFKGNAQVVALLNKAIGVLKVKGATIVEVELVKLIRPLGEAGYEVLQFEFKDGLNKYLSTANAPVKSLKEVIDFNTKNEATAMPFFKQETLISSNLKGGLGSKEYLDAIAKSTSSRKIITDLFKENRLDAVCGITSGPAGCIDIINGDYGTGFSFSSPAAMAGFPHITLPMGLVHELPIGFSIVGTAYSDGEILKIAYAFEQATKARQAPRFLENIG
jgi:amidase